MPVDGLNLGIIMFENHVNAVQKKAAQAACKRKTTAYEPCFCGVCAACLQAA